MTIKEAIDLVDLVKPNQYDEATKVRWLSKHDGQIFAEVMMTHADCPMDSFAGYDGTDLNAELLVPAPYADDVYNYYLQAQIDKENGEIAKFNQAIVLYNSAYQAYASHYNRYHMPLSVGKRFRF